MIPINIQVSRSKVKPILDMLGKGGISVSQTFIFHQRFESWEIKTALQKALVP